MVGMGSKRVRIANLHHKIWDWRVRYAFSNYGEIQEKHERWPKAYHYSVSNGIRIVVIL